MYSRCLFCHDDLGSNELIESFPVGRRLAFDAAKGRLWVVCRRCQRWNLTPLEERWEAIEECERRFGATRLRISTDNIGMTRLREGLELIRVGEPLRPELAAWRYTDRFRTRRRNALVASAATGAAALAVAGGGLALGIGAGIGGSFWQLQGFVSRYRDNRRIICRMARQNDVVLVRGEDIESVVLHPAGDNAPVALTVYGASGVVRAEGAQAIRVAAKVLSRLNHRGGTPSDVAGAVEWLDKWGDPLRHAAPGAWTQPLRLAQLYTVQRLALEIAANEEEERVAMLGELADLEAAWRDAEEIAAIADDLLLPTYVTEYLSRTRGHAEHGA